MSEEAGWGSLVDEEEPPVVVVVASLLLLLLLLDEEDDEVDSVITCTKSRSCVNVSF